MASSEMIPSGVHVCRKCLRVLDESSTSGFQHTMQDMDADHAPDPAPYHSVMEVRGRCDFCNRDHPDFVLPVRDYVVAPGHVNQGDWAACKGCAALIEKDQWSALVRRVVAIAMETKPESERKAVEVGVPRAYRMLRKHIIGSLKPLHGDRFGVGSKAQRA